MLAGELLDGISVCKREERIREWKGRERKRR